MRIFAKIITSSRDRTPNKCFDEHHIGSGFTLQGAITSAVQSWNEERINDDGDDAIQLNDEITFEQLVAMYTDFNSEDTSYVRSVRVWMDTTVDPE
jgi:hypothetical protein